MAAQKAKQATVRHHIARRGWGGQTEGHESYHYRFVFCSSSTTAPRPTLTEQTTPRPAPPTWPPHPASVQSIPSSCKTSWQPHLVARGSSSAAAVPTRATGDPRGNRLRAMSVHAYQCSFCAI